MITGWGCVEAVSSWQEVQLSETQCSGSGVELEDSMPSNDSEHEVWRHLVDIEWCSGSVLFVRQMGSAEVLRRELGCWQNISTAMQRLCKINRQFVMQNGILSYIIF